MLTTKLGNRYEVAAELGRGGMGVVYRSRDPLLNRDVAVKVLATSELTPEIEERFQREAQIVAQMDHPGIVPIYDVGR
ncbi:MAG TPA: protein kinase, partial [Thermoanaerobaculia bacterium]|nr:protein kinase [Thermoanaerobaculia bacterium]